MAYLNHEQLAKMWQTLPGRISALDLPSSASAALDKIYNRLDAWGDRYTDAIKTGGHTLTTRESTAWQDAFREQDAAVAYLESKYPKMGAAVAPSRASIILPEEHVTGALPWWYWPLRVTAGIGAGYIAYKILRSVDPDKSQTRAFAGVSSTAANYRFQTIRVDYRADYGISKSKRFKTLAGARKFAQRLVGRKPEVSETYNYATTSTGADRITASIPIRTLFPEQKYYYGHDYRLED